MANQTLTLQTSSKAPPPPPVEQAHNPPPPAILSLYKQYSKIALDSIQNDPYILDFDRISEYHKDRLVNLGTIPKERLDKSYAEFLSNAEELEDGTAPPPELESATTIYTHKNVPGLLLLPSLPPRVQKHMLPCLLKRDLKNPAHKTNLHAHYDLPYHALADKDATVFSIPPSTSLRPLDPTIHKEITIRQALQKKLRWMTLGGQYDWTKKVYPEMASSGAPADGNDENEQRRDRPEDVPPFPEDLKRLIQALFPDITPEAAISNFYSPGDRLSPHRDISEKSSKGLVSISIGCDALFLCGLQRLPTSDTSVNAEDDGRDNVLLVRVKSGDVLVMNGESRWAWHAVPKVIPGTCPEWLRAWPGSSAGGWEGWMGGKRVNLNVRQMWD